VDLQTTRTQSRQEGKCTVAWGTAKYLAVHLNETITRGKLGLSLQTLEVLEARKHRESHGSDYAGGSILCMCGWACYTGDTERSIFSHNGSNNMNFWSVWLAPAKGLGIFVTSDLVTNGI